MPSLRPPNNALPKRCLFLPGAGGSAGFWRPVADQLGLSGTFLSWPGLGNEPPSSAVSSLDDLVAMVLDHLTAPTAIVAQSMGGLIAVKAALAAPDMVQSLVLTVTSGGVPMADLGAADWRDDYYATYPNAQRWIGTATEDLSDRIGTITAPTLLLWGDSDPISPLAVGQRLAGLLPNADLQIIAGGDHDLAITHAPRVAALIAEHWRNAHG